MFELPLDESVRYLKGVGEARYKLYQKLGIYTVSDLLCHFPRDWEDRGNIKRIADLEPGERATIRATVANLREYRARGGMLICKVWVFDDSASMTLTFFNNRYIKSYITPESEYLFFGEVKTTLTEIEMTSPQFEKFNEGKKQGSGILPVYSLRAGLTQKQLRKNMQDALLRFGDRIEEYMPSDILGKYHLLGIKEAMSAIHFPPDRKTLDVAKRRIAFDELFLFSLKMAILKQRRKQLKGIPMTGEVMWEEFFGKLPFPLTGAQKKTIAEIEADLKKETPMSRMIQGDVGSGKTIVAAGAAYFTIKNGYQAVMMAPTEILAEQHMRTLAPFMNANGIRCGLLCASLGAKQKREIKEKIKNHQIDFIIGTHALIQDDVEFSRLGLIITDEQHRFGVNQRAALARKGDISNILVMSATPIPRTLGMALFGDLDISIIDELPPGRQKIETYLVDEKMRPRILSFIQKETDKNHQVYIVCPLVEESEKLDYFDVTQYAADLKKKLPGLSVGIVHGRMKGEQKDDIMRSFANGEIQVLVATTVIEVGVNVPSATVMIIENAQRFGLSQLHQLRGRVGRGSEKSYCILFGQQLSEKTKKRLSVMCRTNDGFEIAAEDYRQRGPGDFFGQMQHGLPLMKAADIFSDAKTLLEAQEAANQLLAKDPDLKNSEHTQLGRRIFTVFNCEKNQDIFN